MSLKPTLATILLMAFVASPFAQTGSREDTGAGDARQAPTAFEMFSSKLKLDSKTQVPAAEEIFQAAAREAAPVNQQMLEERQRLVNLTLGSREAEMPAVRDAYVQSAASMAAIEVRAFTKVYSTLKSNQQSGGVEAFGIIAGIFHPSAPAGGRRSGGGRAGGDARLETAGAPVPSFVQRGRGSSQPSGGGSVFFTRFEILASAFRLDKTQEKPVKTILDGASKDATPIRDQLARTRTALGTAVVGNKPQPEVDEAVKNYADQAAAMTVLEMKALAQVLQSLTKEQMANAAGVQTAFFLMRGMFLEKRWDDIPTGRSY
jgi:hypothetical protein